MSDEERSVARGRIKPPLRPIELFEVTEAPDYDDDVKEWRVLGIPVRLIWGDVSDSGEWIGGGHRTDGKRRWRAEADERVSRLWLPDWWREPATEIDDEVALKAPPHVCVGERVYVSNIDGTLCLFPNYKDRLIGFCLQEDHAGRGLETTVHAGIWNIGTQKWVYNCNEEYKMMDWRYDVPYPDAGSTGTGQWKESTDNGAIIEVQSLDCDTPGACCA